MKIRKLLLIAALALLFPLAPVFGQTNFGISLDFHSALSPYGSWLNVGSYGECWRPYAAADFMPFSDDGYWDYTDYGPMWTSDEPWGWAAYHYGQWVYDPQFGWVWQPGYTWQAAPVEWAYGPGYIGWSPFIGAGYNNFDFFVFLNGNDWGDHDYQGRLIRGGYARQLMDRGSFRTQQAPLGRNQLETITHRTITPVPVQERTVQIGGHTTRLVMPQNRANRILSEVQQASRATTLASRNGNFTPRDQERQNQYVAPQRQMERPSMENQNQRMNNQQQAERPRTNQPKNANHQAAKRNKERPQKHNGSHS